MLPSLSNDQFVLGICLIAVVGSGLIMYFSYFLGRFTGALPMPEPVRMLGRIQREDLTSAAPGSSRSQDKAAA